MRKVLAILALQLLMAGVLFASLPWELRTGMRDWRGFSKAEKRACILGFVHATLAKGPPDPYITPADVDSLVAKIDVIYADRANSKIPLMRAVDAASLAVKGASDRAFKNALRTYRRDYRGQW